jgi:hypothetical protein
MFLNDCYSHFLSGLWLDIAVSVSVSLIICSFVIVIGGIVDFIENVVLHVLTSLIGAGPAMFICNRLTFPGVMLHELSHALMIFITGGHVTAIKLFEFNTNGRLGHVEFQLYGSKRQQMIQLTFGSSAPVIFGMASVYGLLRLLFLVESGTLFYYIVIYFIFSIGCHMSMSRSDIKNYFNGAFFVWLLLSSIMMVIQYFFV